MNHKALEQAENQIQAILEKNATETALLKQRLQEAQDKLAGAQRKRENAVLLKNEKAFADASLETLKTKEEIEFLEKRITYYAQTPLIEETQYRDLLKAVYDESGAYLDEKALEIGRILIGFEETLAEISGIIDRTDTAVRTLQQSILRTPVPEGYKNNRDFYFDTQGERFKVQGIGTAGYERVKHHSPEELLSAILSLRDVKNYVEEAKNDDHPGRERN